jgi:hypothetical protein
MNSLLKYAGTTGCLVLCSQKILILSIPKLKNGNEQAYFYYFDPQKKNWTNAKLQNSVARVRKANYTDLATAACRRS